MKVLIGSTGFVGGTIASHVNFDRAVHRSTLDEIRGLSAEMVVCAGMPAAKWLVNQNAEADRANMERLLDALSTVSAERFVLISTIDVYSHPEGVDELVAPDQDQDQAYGRHRAQLEGSIRTRFPQSLILRLPALYGHRLRKNFVFDLLEHAEDQYMGVNPASSYQFFDVARTWQIAEAAQNAGIDLLNVATEPVTASDVAGIFGVELTATYRPRASYDMRTRHAAKLGRGEGSYLFSRREALDGIAALRASWTGPAK